PAPPGVPARLRLDAGPGAGSLPVPLPWVSGGLPAYLGDRRRSCCTAWLRGDQRDPTDPDRWSAAHYKSVWGHSREAPALLRRPTRGVHRSALRRRGRGFRVLRAGEDEERAALV